MCEIVQFPVKVGSVMHLGSLRPIPRLPADPHNPPPRAAGRMAVFQDIDPDDCPYPAFTPAWMEWRTGYAEGYGLPNDAPGQLAVMLEVAGEQYATLQAIRAIGTPQIQAMVDECRAKNRRPRGNLVPLRVTV